MGDDATLLRFFDSPTGSEAHKKAALETLAKKAHLSDLARRFLLVLVEHRRIGALKAVAAELAEMRDRAAGIVPAEATFAKEPGPAEEKAMLAALEKMTGSRVRLSVKVDPDLLGGATARVGSRIYDGSQDAAPGAAPPPGEDLGPTRRGGIAATQRSTREQRQTWRRSRRTRSSAS